MKTEYLTADDGTRLFCRIRGDGPPLILVHGACVDGSFFDATTALLSVCFTVWTYDRRGYGQSICCPSASFSPDTQVQDLETVVSHCGSAPYLAAHSIGCSIASLFAQKNPGKARKILLFEPVYVDVLPEESVWRQQIARISELKASGKEISAANRFILLLGPQDPRGSKPTTCEIEYASQNRAAFIHNELELLSYPFPEVVLPDESYIGIGESDRDTAFGRMAVSLAQRSQLKTIFFPGRHNCPRDLPCEFSAMMIGLFQPFL